MMLRKYNAIIQRYTNQQSVAVTPGCNAWAARNIGNDVVRVNGIELQPPPGPGLSGESVSIDGNEGEEYVGRIDVVFAGVGANPIVEIIQKFYL